jgi:hypothetical protein
MSFPEAMKQVEAAALARNRELPAAWEHFYAICTVENVCHHIRHYLEDFAVDGTPHLRPRGALAGMSKAP